MHITFVGCGDAFGSGGRLNTCFHVRAARTSFLIDCGASSLIGMNRFGIDRNAIDTILVTHFHADHFGGIPFFMLDAQFKTKRSRPLTIAGPRDLRPRLDALREALFPGSSVMTPKFPLEWIAMEPGRPHPVLDLVVTPEPARHTRETNPTALRVQVGGQVVAYTGDTEWTDDVARAARDADLLIAECYFHDKPVKWHLNYPDIRERASQVGAKRVILTHMSREMLARAASVPEECAHDGLVVEVAGPG